MNVASAQQTPQNASARVERLLDRGWRFYFGQAPAGVTDPGFDDRDWAAVDVPHSWNQMGNYALKPAIDSDARQGVGWYRLTFDMPATTPERRQVLQFDGVGARAEVWVNGVRIGEHQGAFSRFRFDVTEHLRSGAANLIVVRADNSKPAAGSSTEHVLPLGGDFFVHGGIYRPVSLISTGQAQIDLSDHGGPGVYISTPKVSRDNADVEVRARLRTFAARSRPITMITTIRDAAGVAVAHDRVTPTLDAGGGEELRRTLHLSRPNLWRGRASPYLYQLSVELADGPEILDRVVQTFGVRTFAFDPDRGFLLNGEPLPLHGASRHQDRAGKGWALTAQDEAEDLAIMAEMGVNTIRHAHYQHSQGWALAADMAGMVVWAELPFVHESSLTDDDPTPQVLENAKAQLVELIRQNFNHPSIVMWSIGNEVDIRPALAALRPGATARPARSLAMLQKLNALAKQEDGARPTAYADCCEDTAMQLQGAQVLSGVADVTGYNRYYGWYYGRPEDTGPALDALHAKYPNAPIAIAEYGAGGAFSQHTDNPEGGPVNAFGRPHPEEYQSWVHERTWPLLAARPYLAGSWIWNMFDFASTSREEGEASDLNDKGLVSYDRRSRKDAFYYYKANWSAEPVLYITGRRYRDRAYGEVDVKIYSNAPQATLRVNEKIIGVAKCPGRICLWRGVALRAGANTIAASARFSDRVLADSVTWIAPDPQNGLFIDAGALVGSIDHAGQRFGSDTFFAGGVGRDINAPGVGGRRPKAPVSVIGTADSLIYGSYREGRFGYDLPLVNGDWTVSLAIMEPDDAPNSVKAAQRRFNVSANGVTRLKAFNPVGQAGGARRAIVKQFPVRVKRGRLRLDFRPIVGEAVVSAIFVTRTPTSENPPKSR